MERSDKKLRMFLTFVEAVNFLYQLNFIFVDFNAFSSDSIPKTIPSCTMKWNFSHFNTR